MIYISPSLVLSGSDAEDANAPAIGYRNLATALNTTATSAEAEYPIANVANVSTASLWRATSDAIQYLTVLTGTSEPIDYVGIARHNFGSQAIAISVEGRSSASDAWQELAPDVLVAEDRPIVYRFTPQALYQVRLKLASGDAPAELGIFYVGKLLVAQRRLYVGHTPLQMGIETQVVTGRSESGNFLGRIVTGQSQTTAVALTELTPGWVRSSLMPFLRAAQTHPFFWAWRPMSYPSEVGFSWMLNDPRPSNSRPNGFMECEFQIGGLAV